MGKTSSAPASSVSALLSIVVVVVVGVGDAHEVDGSAAGNSLVCLAGHPGSPQLGRFSRLEPRCVLRAARCSGLAMKAAKGKVGRAAGRQIGPGLGVSRAGVAVEGGAGAVAGRSDVCLWKEQGKGEEGRRAGKADRGGACLPLALSNLTY